MSDRATRPVFGYGSLLNPHSLVERFTPALDYPLGETAVEEWRAIRARLTLVPVRLSGYGRYYCVRSENHDSLALAVRPEPDEWCNGVLVGGLTAEERARVDDSEAAFRTRSVPVSAFDPYELAGVPDLDELDPDASATLYLADPDEPTVFDFETDRSRNEYYHQLIDDGITLLAEEFDAPSFERRFRADFEATTYQPTATGFEPISETTPER